MTSTNVRFVVDDRDMIIDRLNNANSRIARACYDDTYGNRLESDTDLREQLLRHHLGRICGNLFYPLKPSEDGSDAIDYLNSNVILLVGISGFDARRAQSAFWHLKRHACLVRDQPERFGPYTHQFIDWLDRHWPELSSRDFSESLLRLAREHSAVI
jgi:hypothetical protein